MRDRRRRTTTAAVVVTATLTAGCADGGGWFEPSSYAYVLESACNGGDLVGTFDVVVQDGAVVDVMPLDEDAETSLWLDPDADVPTLDALADDPAAAGGDGDCLHVLDYAEGEFDPFADDRFADDPFGDADDDVDDPFFDAP